MGSCLDLVKHDLYFLILQNFRDRVIYRIFICIGCAGQNCRIGLFQFCTVRRHLHDLISDLRLYAEGYDRFVFYKLGSLY